MKTTLAKLNDLLSDGMIPDYRIIDALTGEILSEKVLEANVSYTIREYPDCQVIVTRIDHSSALLYVYVNPQRVNLHNKSEQGSILYILAVLPIFCFMLLFVWLLLGMIVGDPNAIMVFSWLEWVFGG